MHVQYSSNTEKLYDCMTNVWQNVWWVSYLNILDFKYISVFISGSENKIIIMQTHIAKKSTDRMEFLEKKKLALRKAGRKKQKNKRQKKQIENK